MFSSMVSVVVTSRPSASAPLCSLPDIDRFVEMRGFNREHIVEYIRSEFVPLNCAIICHLWHTLEKALPVCLSLSTFESLPADLQKSWCLLCELLFRLWKRVNLSFLVKSYRHSSLKA